MTKVAASERTGVVFVVLAVVLWGLFPVFTKVGVETMTPILFAGATSLIASLPLVAVAVFLRQMPSWRSPVWKELVYIAVTGTTLPFLLFFTGTALTTGLNAGMLQQMEPVYSLVLSYFLLREHIPPRQVVGCLMILMGALVVLSAGNGQAGVGAGMRLGKGDLLVMLAPLGYQLAHARTKRLLADGATSFLISGFRLLIGGSLLLILAAAALKAGLSPMQFPPLTPALLLAVLGYSVVIVAAEKVLWLEGIRRINLSKASGFLPMSVLASALGAVLILGESLRPLHYTGAVLILAGSLILSTVPSQRRTVASG